MKKRDWNKLSSKEKDEEIKKAIDEFMLWNPLIELLRKRVLMEASMHWERRKRFLSIGSLTGI